MRDWVCLILESAGQLIMQHAKYGLQDGAFVFL